MESARSDCSADEDLSFIETLRADAQNPMIKNFSQEDSLTDDTKDLEEFLNSLDWNQWWKRRVTSWGQTSLSTDYNT